LSQRISKVAGIETKIQIRGRTAIIDTSSIPPESLDLVKTLLSFEPGIDRVE
jgi:hypothetical protein